MYLKLLRQINRVIPAKNPEPYLLCLVKPDVTRFITFGRKMQILGKQTVEISNWDLQRPRNKEFYSRLKPGVIRRLTAKRRTDGQLQLPILRVRKKTRPFELPENCVLLAIEGTAMVAARGRGCAIWFAEDLSLEAEVAALGAGNFRLLASQVVSLLPIEELRRLLPNVPSHHLNIKQGEIDYLFLAHHGYDFPSSHRMGAEINGTGTILDLHIDTIDSAVARRGNLSFRNEVYLEEWLREEIHETIWETDRFELGVRIDMLLQGQHGSRCPASPGIAPEDPGVEARNGLNFRGIQPGG